MPKTSHFVLAAAALMLGACLAVLGTILSFVEPPPLPRALAIVGALAGIVVTALSLRWLIALNRQWKEAAVARFEERPQETLLEWEIPLEDWTALSKFEEQRSKESAPFASGCLGLVIAGIVAWSTWGWLGSGGAIIASLTGGAVAFVLAWFGLRGVRMHGYTSALAAGRGSVALRPDSLLLNGGEVIPWGGLHGALETFEIDEEEGLDFPVLTIEIRKQSGNGSFLQRIRLPVAKAVIDQLAGNMPSVG